MHGEFIKPLFKVLRSALEAKRRPVVKVQHGVGWVIDVRGPVVDRLLVKDGQPVIAQHGPTNVSNQVLNFQTLPVVGPPKQGPVVHLADVFRSRHDLGRERAREEDHAVQGVQRLSGEVAQHGLFDKGLDVFTRLRKVVTIDIEVERHRMAVQRLGHLQATCFVKVFTQQLLCIFRFEGLQLHNRPVKAFR